MYRHTASLEDNKDYVDIFLIHDPSDQEILDDIEFKLSENGIKYLTLPGKPEMNMFNEFVCITKRAKKTMFILSSTSSKNRSLIYLVSIALFTISKDYFITVYVAGDELVQDELHLLQQTSVIRTDTPLWLEQLITEVQFFTPSYTCVLSKGNVIDSLMFQGLCIRHMQSEIYGVLVMADKLCLQINLSEYLEYQKCHKTYNTSKVFQEFKGLCDINSTLTLVLRNGDAKSSMLALAKHDIADFAAATIDTSVARAKCYWALVCTIQGKQGNEEQNFLKAIHPLIAQTLRNKFVETVIVPIKPNFELLGSRVESFPESWKNENMEQVKTISSAGFFYPGFGEYGRCFHCGIAVVNIRAYQKPLLHHAAACPTCKFVKKNLTEFEIEDAVAQMKDSEWEKNKTADSIRQMFKEKEKRLETFSTCYFKLHYEYVAESLASAGFYHVGLENVIQCFACGIRLYNIETDQNPWSIHASLSPNCSYLIGEKGRHFIEEIQAAQDTTLNQGYTVMTFLRKTHDREWRRDWPKNMFKPW